MSRGINMISFEGSKGLTMRNENFDPLVSQAEQLKAVHEGPITLVGTYTSAPEHMEEMIEGWTKRAMMMRGQPGFISSQLYRAIGDASVLVNVAVWESLPALRAAQAAAVQQPLISNDVLGRAVLVEKVAVPGLCVA